MASEIDEGPGRQSPPEDRYLRAQLHASKDMCGYFGRLAAEKADMLAAQRKQVVRLDKDKKALRAELIALQAECAAVRKDRDRLLAYADALELRLKRVLSSRTWRVMEPVRIVGRGLRAILFRRKPVREPLPKRPVPSSVAPAADPE